MRTDTTIEWEMEDFEVDTEAEEVDTIHTEDTMTAVTTIVVMVGMDINKITEMIDTTTITTATHMDEGVDAEAMDHREAADGVEEEEEGKGDRIIICIRTMKTIQIITSNKAIMKINTINQNKNKHNNKQKRHSLVSCPFFF